MYKTYRLGNNDVKLGDTFTLAKAMGGVSCYYIRRLERSKLFPPNRLRKPAPQRKGVKPEFMKGHRLYTRELIRGIGKLFRQRKKFQRFTEEDRLEILRLFEEERVRIERYLNT